MEENFSDNEVIVILKEVTEEGCTIGFQNFKTVESVSKIAAMTCGIERMRS